MTLSQNNLGRRRFVITGGVATLLAALPTVASALTADQSKSLVTKLVADINKIINSGKSEAAMYKDFNRIFGKYAYVSGIARSALGPPARSANKGELNAFTKAFQGYISRKYGRRFREFIGGKIEVKRAKKVKSFFQVDCKATLKGEAPFDVTFMVSDRSGKGLFFDMLIEGISMLKVEKAEIGSMLDKRRGNLGQMINDLKKAG